MYTSFYLQLIKIMAMLWLVVIDTSYQNDFLYELLVVLLSLENSGSFHHFRNITVEAGFQTMENRY